MVLFADLMKFQNLLIVSAFLTGCVFPSPSKSRNNSSPDSALPGFESEYTAQQFAALDEQSQMLAYAKACEKKLGKIPRIDCFSGVEVPTGNTTQSGFIPHGHTGTTYSGSWNDERTCDRPSIALSSSTGKGGCTPFSRVGRAQPQTGFKTEWVTMCRRYFDRPAGSTRFDDVSIVGYDRESGAACFFASKFNETPPTSEADDKGVDARRVPEVTEKDSLKVFMSLKGHASSSRCVSCHSTHAWLRIPYLQQVQWNGKPIVPEVSAKDPYYLVAFNYMEAVHNEKWRPKTLVSPEIKTCSGCHRIGGDVYASYFVPTAVGILKNLRGQEDETVAPKYSKETLKFPMNLHFDFGHKYLPVPKSEADWNLSKFKAAADFIHQCGLDPDKPECVWESVVGNVKAK